MRDVTGIAVRCPFGRPAVIESAPTLAGKPNPNLLYLTCPTATVAMSTVEAGGGVKRLKALSGEDRDLRHQLSDISTVYRQRRATLASSGDPRPEAGIGGPSGPDKASCLHAYAAALLAALAGWFDMGGSPSTGNRGGAPADVAARAADAAWDRFLPPRNTLWCTDDRCACWAQEPAAGTVARGHGQLGGDLPRVAAIDVGTISVRLLVADVRDGRPEQVVRQAEITRLGEGLRPGMPLGSAARERTAVAVGRFVAEARALGAEKITVAGTSACRDAADGARFIQSLAVAHETVGVVLSGVEEASLAYRGAALDVPRFPVVLDVGGGSTELIRASGGGDVESVSLALGASRATEWWIHSDPPGAEEMASIARETTSLTAPLRPRFGKGQGIDVGAGSDPGLVASAETRLVGVAGTVTTLACLDAGLQAYDPEVIHLRLLSLQAVDRLIGLLAAMTTAERASLPCVQAGRAPVIVAGALIAKAAMQALGYPEMTVSERDILDGLVLAAAC